MHVFVIYAALTLGPLLIIATLGTIMYAYGRKLSHDPQGNDR